MKAYFIHLGQPEGPYSIEELRVKNLSKDTPVWYEGLNDWSTIGQIPELRSIAKATPPPFKTVGQSEYEYQLAMEEFFQEKRKISWGTILLVTLVVASFISLLVMMNKPS